MNVRKVLQLLLIILYCNVAKLLPEKQKYKLLKYAGRKMLTAAPDARGDMWRASQNEAHPEADRKIMQELLRGE